MPQSKFVNISMHTGKLEIPLVLVVDIRVSSETDDRLLHTLTVLDLGPAELDKN